MPAAKAKAKTKPRPQAKAKRPAYTPSERTLEEMTHLNWRMRLFVHYYLTQSQGNQRDAATRAGYPCPDNAGMRLLKNAQVRSAIASRSEAALSSDEILGQLADMASYDVSDCIDPLTGTVDLERVLASGKGHLIREVTPTANGPSVKLYSRKEALELLGKYRKLWVERISLEDFDPSKLSVEQLQAIVAKGRG